MSGPFGASQWMYATDSGFYDFPISNSVRLGEDGHLTHTNGSDSASRQKFTFSTWLKISSVGTGHHQLFDATNNYGRIYFTADDNGGNTIRVLIGDGSSNSDIVTNRKFRDVSSWFHLVVAIDTTQGTASNRVKIYINGVQETSFYRNTIMNQNVTTKVGGTALEFIGAQAGPDTYFKGYLAETHYIVNAQLTPSSFGETKNDIWIPKDTAGLTYGTNGYRLQYKQTGTSANSSGIGADTSGNNNHWTPVNLVASDVVPDSPTNNFATLNNLDTGGSNATYTEGNLKIVTNSGSNSQGVSTIPIPYTGKYYWEVHITATSGTISDHSRIGIQVGSAVTPSLDVRYRSDGTKSVENSGSNYGASYAANDIVSIAVDSDNNTVTFFKNGSSQGAINYTLTANQTYLPIITEASSQINITYVANFGQDSSFAGNATAQGNADENGIGDFYYAPPSGFLALCTANLPDPVATIDPNKGGSPQDYFNTVLYTGNGSDNRSITGAGFDPDWVWIKARNEDYSHVLGDSVRGNNKFLSSNTTAVEDTNTGAIQDFITDGFQVGTYNGVNQNTKTYVAWNWKANGSGSSNTNGTINTTATSVAAHGGFSISTYTGTGSNATVGHGLSSAPKLVIVKRRNATENWVVGEGTFTGRLLLDETEAYADTTAQWRDTVPSSTVVTIGTHNSVNGSSDTYVMYCFANVDGMQKIGQYTGNENDDGTFVYTGFRPAFILIKKVAAGDWGIYDSKRDGFNESNAVLYPAEAIAEENQASRRIDLLSNGFKLRTNNVTFNDDSATIYMAFAEQPFKYANAR